MFERVVVIGAGAAGLAATWAAAQRGAEIRLYDGGVGCSCLNGGALDDRPWEQVARATEVLQHVTEAGPLPESVRAFARQLGLWRLPDQGQGLCRLATEAGRVRLARGHDRSLLDLARLPVGARVALPRVVRPEWDADSLAASLCADAYARSRGIQFEAMDAKVLKHVGEDRIASAELASRHDEPARRGWLAERLRESLRRATGAQGQDSPARRPFDAVLIGPWLGADKPIASWLAEQLGVPVGETVSGVGCAAGMRFESARLALLSSLGIELVPRQVAAVRNLGDELAVTIEGGEEQAATDAVVLAIGGLAAGGVVYDPPEQSAGQDVPLAGRAAFRLSVDVPVRLQAFRKPIDVVGSIHGPALDEVAWPVDADPGLLEAVGVACQGAEAAPRVYGAGDVVADRPRTMLQAVYSGVLAGAAAAGEPGQL
ncbi:MAG: FAD-dependent oxidoreductase [Deltaproteobacteria bacterium]|nr:FAD-dependent oxidoreductase [Deltaproteobacteria bacterium]